MFYSFSFYTINITEFHLNFYNSLPHKAELYLCGHIVERTIVTNTIMIVRPRIVCISNIFKIVQLSCCAEGGIFLITVAMVGRPIDEGTVVRRGGSISTGVVSTVSVPI